MERRLWPATNCLAAVRGCSVLLVSGSSEPAVVGGGCRYSAAMRWRQTGSVNHSRPVCCLRRMLLLYWVRSGAIPVKDKGKARCDFRARGFPTTLTSLSVGPQVPCYFIFGDSLVDSGNNNDLNTKAKANYRPYGIDFPKGATGIFTNGQTMADIIGSSLSLCLIVHFLRYSYDHYMPIHL
ncbi:hypothetical protein OSB04_un000801 [Centaurea solstitialis]|uniref:GDSL esterase/lipase n=1 Tax=Centaurea solstitialis TaxID=347529 RepID=A0AA38SHB3_9ASTR|nr:hypothetical protein OSB04_un000801 [Centaurea solstitialis]